MQVETGAYFRPDRAQMRSGDGPLSVRVRPSSIMHDCDRRATGVRGRCMPASWDAAGMGPRLRYGRKMPRFRIKQAASLLGVSTDTMRRWADQGRVETTTDASGRRAVDGTALTRLAGEMAGSANHLEGRIVVAQSVRNKFPGLVTRVIRDTVMAQVEIQAGPHIFVSLLSRETADELGLKPGMLAVAAVKATSVSVEIPGSRPARP